MIACFLSAITHREQAMFVLRTNLPAGFCFAKSLGRLPRRRFAWTGFLLRKNLHFL